MKYWQFSNTRREFIVELIILFSDSNHLLMPPLQISKFEKGLLCASKEQSYCSHTRHLRFRHFMAVGARNSF